MHRRASKKRLKTGGALGTSLRQQSSALAPAAAVRGPTPDLGGASPQNWAFRARPQRRVYTDSSEKANQGNVICVAASRGKPDAGLVNPNGALT